jgi:hypothetical protein
MTFCWAFVSFDQGASRSILLVSATASSMREKYCVRAVLHGAMAPSEIDRSGLGTTRSASTSKRVPRPSHVGQAP